MLLDQFGDRRARDQHPRIDVERETGVPATLRQIHHGHTLAQPPLGKPFDLGNDRNRRAPPQLRRGQRRLAAQRMHEERRRVIACIEGAMPVEQLRPTETACHTP